MSIHTEDATTTRPDANYAPLPDTLVIGFTGHAHHGKDEACRIIISRFGIGAMTFAFSDAISVVARAMYGMTTRNPRLLQQTGYEARQGNPRIWTDALYWLIHERKPRVALISGVRFPDEAAMVKEMGGFMVKVERFTETGERYCSGDRDANYPTETGIDALPVDYTIRNESGRLDDFRDMVLSTFVALSHRKGLDR